MDQLPKLGLGAGQFGFKTGNEFADAVFDSAAVGFELRDLGVLAREFLAQRFKFLLGVCVGRKKLKNGVFQLIKLFFPD